MFFYRDESMFGSEKGSVLIIVITGITIIAAIGAGVATMVGSGAVRVRITACQPRPILQLKAAWRLLDLTSVRFTMPVAPGKITAGLSSR